MYFPDRGCVHTLLTLYVYATVCTVLLYVRTTTDPTVHMYTVLSSATRQPPADTPTVHRLVGDRDVTDDVTLADGYYDAKRKDVADNIEDDDVGSVVVSDVSDVRDDVRDDADDDVSDDVMEARDGVGGGVDGSLTHRSAPFNDVRRRTLSPEFIRVMQSLWPGLEICAGPRCDDQGQRYRCSACNTSLFHSLASSQGE